MISKFFRSAAVAIAALTAIAVPATAARAEPIVLDTAAVDRYINEYLGKAGYPGVSVAITKGDKVWLTAGYGREPGCRRSWPPTAPSK